jgi:hypothetical protein
MKKSSDTIGNRTRVLPVEWNVALCVSTHLSYGSANVFVEAVGF